MSARLLGPEDAREALARRIDASWAKAICAEAQGEPYAFDISLRVNVKSGADVERIGTAVWEQWRAMWRRIELPSEAGSGAWIESSSESVRRGTQVAPRYLRAPDLASAEGALAVLGGGSVGGDIARARVVATRMRAAGVALTTSHLKKLVSLSDTDLDALARVVRWLADHQDLSRWTARQLPIPRVHTKWLDDHKTLVNLLTGRDLDAELCQRPTVVHLSYVDPDYLAQPDSPRRHDSWTAGDSHAIAYSPHTVLVVDNRDCRISFPEVSGTVVVEGNGAAATALIAGIPWVRDAERVIYWGDMDADGYAILDRFRAALPKVTSILMDVVAMDRHAEHGVNEDRDGKPLKPSGRALDGLTAGERAAYSMIATSGEADFRRIEQEKLPREEAIAALISSPSG